VVFDLCPGSRQEKLQALPLVAVRWGAFEGRGGDQGGAVPWGSVFLTKDPIAGEIGKFGLVRRVGWASL
jgi:hypothetical protein